MHETISDVATAHAHLDSVLSPEAALEAPSEVTDEQMLVEEDPSAAVADPVTNVEPSTPSEPQTSVVEVDTSPPADDTGGAVLGQVEPGEVVGDRKRRGRSDKRDRPIPLLRGSQRPPTPCHG